MKTRTVSTADDFETLGFLPQTAVTAQRYLAALVHRADAYRSTLAEEGER
jgi:hypothetical protein